MPIVSSSFSTSLLSGIYLISSFFFKQIFHKNINEQHFISGINRINQFFAQFFQSNKSNHKQNDKKTTEITEKKIEL